MKSILSDSVNHTVNGTSAFPVGKEDIIFVNVVSLGKTVMSTAISGKSSVEELMEALRHQLAGCDGLLTVNLRNRTQGTSTKRVLRLRKPSAGILRTQMKGYAA